MRTPTILATNDDGIDSPLFAALVRALLPLGRVVVAAPDGERSWIGKAVSRQKPLLRAVPHEAIFGCPAWSIDGTPADCVNLALGHLVGGRADIVVSGINMGSNAGLPLILASGTVGGALEGALAGAHAVASSIRLGKADFARLKLPDATLPAHVAAVVDAIAVRTAELCAQIVRKPRPRRPIVHNLNFPPNTTPETPLVRTTAAHLRVGPLWVPASEPGTYSFAFNVGDEAPSPHLTDRACIDAGQATHAILDFGRLAVTTGAARADALGTAGAARPRIQ
jgi:5'-nucleotidase